MYMSLFFFFKQKTAYEMRISDWSSDVCSSDLLAEGRPPPPLIDLIRQPLYVPQSMGVLDLLAEMRAKRTHLAIVIDEYSGTEGLLTIEDLVEEIVGEIEDEHDDEPEPLIVAGEDGCWEADARAELDDVEHTSELQSLMRISSAVFCFKKKTK